MDNKPHIINGIEYHFHPTKDYDKAKAWLQEIGKWDYISTHGFSTDGWSIISTANSIWNNMNKSKQ
jgi:hypothetical protein